MSSVQTATKEIERIAEKANGVVGVFAHHLESNQTLTFNPNEPFPMASTYKIVPSAEQRFSLDSALPVLSVTGGNEAQVI